MRLASWDLTLIHLPYPRPIHWKDTVETGCDFMLVRLFTDAGHEGVAEAPIKPTWTGTTRRSLAAALEDMLLPSLAGVDVGDMAAVEARLSRFPENRLAKGLVDNACWDLRAQARGAPLWRLWGGSPEVPVSWTVTREKPMVMAREAAQMVGQYGFATLKVKGGQGFETDAQALLEIRAAVGDTVRLYVDANGAYREENTAAYAGLLARHGATHAEDPCDLRPLRFRTLQSACTLPLVVDQRCQTTDDAELFLAQGARALGLKAARVGASTALAIARSAEAAGCRVNVGLHAESALGALASLQVAAAFPRHPDSLPAESTFFLSYADQITHEAPSIREGIVRLDESASLAARVDWKRVERYRV